MTAGPLGFILSLVGLVTDSNKRPALFGLIGTGMIAAIFFLVALCS